jgi:kumamolisin
VPDVSGDADPTTGYTIRVDGETLVIGGTSAVAPLWAGLVAVANQQLGTQVGFIQPAIYAAKDGAGFKDITQGSNGAFSAGPGWDACTGLGSPIANTLIPLLAAPVKKKKKKKSAQPAPVAQKAGNRVSAKKAIKKSSAKKSSKKSSGNNKQKK